MFSDRSISRDHAKVIVDYSTYQCSNSNTRPSLFFVETKARFDSFINGKPCGMEEIVTVPGTNIGAPAPRELVIKLSDGQKQKILVPAGKKVGDRFSIQKKIHDMCATSLRLLHATAHLAVLCCFVTLMFCSS